MRAGFWIGMSREFMSDALRARTIGTLHTLNGSAVFPTDLRGYREHKIRARNQGYDEGEKYHGHGVNKYSLLS